ncbi:MAG: biotin-dependent carboxyltransferase family protein [Pseudomonadota bacterium]
MLHVRVPGIQTTLQGAPRIGTRHLGIPYSGPADDVSMALANRLVGNGPSATCLEITYGGFDADVEQDGSVAIAGACDRVMVSGRPVCAHETLHLFAGDRLVISPLVHGARTYLAVHTGFRADWVFGASSTYLPAGFGGHAGRSLKAGDHLKACGDPRRRETLETPVDLRAVFTGSFALRACVSAETDALDQASRTALFAAQFSAGRQATRMGLSMTGHPMALNSDGLMKSAPVFPGTIQCPPSGIPIVLLCDAQTTGGYPRIAQIARCDRHLLGQIRPGDSIRLLERTPDAAVREDAGKWALLEHWLGYCQGNSRLIQPG